MNKLRKCALVLGSLCLGVASLPTAKAYDLPALNLGLTSFMDGGPPAGPGFYYTHYLQYYYSDTLNNHKGDDLALPPGSNPNLDVWVSASQFIYQSNQDIFFGGKWGMNLIVPVIHTDLSGASPLQDNNGGLGDILVGPYLQWDPIMGDKGPIFMHRFEFQVLTPTGKYDDDREINPGSNFLSLNPYWSGTWFITPRWTTSMRLHYLWNDKNDDPNKKLYDYPGDPASDTQAGQAIHFNYTMAYEVLPKKLRVGLNAYYLKQITDTQRDGDDLDHPLVGDGREQVIGVGPGVLWHISPDQHLFFNTYGEFEAENRPEGWRFNLRYVHHW